MLVFSFSFKIVLKRKYVTVRGRKFMGSRGAILCMVVLFFLTHDGHAVAITGGTVSTKYLVTLIPFTYPPQGFTTPYQLFKFYWCSYYGSVWMVVLFLIHRF